MKIEEAIKYFEPYVERATVKEYREYIQMAISAKKGEREMSSYVNEYKELKQVIADNPHLPILFMADSDCGNPDYAWSIATAKAKLGIVFFNDKWSEEKFYTNEDDLNEDVEDWVNDNHENWTELQKEEATKEKMKEFESQWESAIIVMIRPY